MASQSTSVALVVGEEDLLVERAVTRLVRAATGTGEPGADSGIPGAGGDPAADVHEVAAAALGRGELATLTAPSLFGGACVVVIRDAHDAGKEVAGELTRLAADPPPDVWLVITHAGGAKGKPLLASLAKQGARVIDCPKITRVTERMDFVRAEFRAHGRTIDGGGVRALIDAIGSDLRELAAASGQLAADTTGVVGQAVVARYYRGRAEASGFAVADRAVEGRLAEALEMLRWALAVGLSPAAISGGLAQGVRMLGRVSGAPRGLDSAGLVAEVGAPPWKIDRVRQQLRGWEPEGIARALAAVTEADARVKGEGTSSGYALEVAIHTIVACRNAAHRAP
ncbi:MAG TPA: DNA polymerase III subunit delta [Actinobacteria bacterium]|nr:DNA polymerase III subunit delta [Actinomycetota bacterium]